MCRRGLVASWPAAATTKRVRRPLGVPARHSMTAHTVRVARSTTICGGRPTSRSFMPEAAD